MGLLSTVKSYIEVTKPRIVFLLVFTAIATMYLAYKRNGIGLPHIPLLTFLLAVASITFACAGCNATTCYIDRDLDAAMRRTSKRPIPNGRINPPEKALVWGLLLMAAGSILALLINPLSLLWIILGVFDNVVVYSLLLKRRTPLSVVLGGISGGMPVMFGWSAATGTIDIIPAVLAALVVLWIPGHIWSLAIFSEDDYRKAKVPMLPVVLSLRKALRCIAATVMLMVPLSVAVYWLGGLGSTYLFAAIAAGTAVIALNFYLYVNPTKRAAYLAFKASSPYLFVLFLALMLS